MYYLCSETKGADQLRGHFTAEADPATLFSQMQKAGFNMSRLIFERNNGTHVPFFKTMDAFGRAIFLWQRSIVTETMAKYFRSYTAKKSVKETLLQNLC